MRPSRPSRRTRARSWLSPSNAPATLPAARLRVYAVANSQDGFLEIMPDGGGYQCASIGERHRGGFLVTSPAGTTNLVIRVKADGYGSATVTDLACSPWPTTRAESTSPVGLCTLGNPGSVSEAVCKPSSVPPRAEARIGDGHPSVAAGCPAALAAYPRAGQRTSPPNRSPGTGCALLFGLAPGGVCRVSLRRPTRKPVGGIVTVALVLVSRRTGVTRHPALRSSDFPHETAGSLRRSRATIRPPR